MMIAQAIQAQLFSLLEIEWDEICLEPRAEKQVPVYHKTDVLGLQEFLWE